MNAEPVVTGTQRPVLARSVVHSLIQSHSAMLALVLLAFAVWLGALVQRNVWADELATIRVFQQPDIPSVAAFVASNERHPPLYFIAIWLWAHVAGTGEFALRYFSLWLVTLSVPLVFALGRALTRLYAPQAAIMP